MLALTQPQQLQLPSNQTQPRPTQLPTQPVANLSNKVERPIYNTEEGTSYSTLPIQNIHLRSGYFLQKDSPMIIEERIEEERNIEKHNAKQKIQKSRIITTQTPSFP